jgi:hypothetical protein
MKLARSDILRGTMREATPPLSHDQDVPTKSSEEKGECEPLTPQTGPETEERNAPLPEEETYERDGKEQRAAEKPPVED